MDQERSIHKVYRAAIQKSDILLDALYIKNMALHQDAERASSLSLYERALRAPSQETMEVLKSQYGEKQRR